MALLPEQAQLKKNQFQGEGIICMWVFYPSYCIVTSSYQRLVAALKESEGVINYMVFPWHWEHVLIRLNTIKH